ncbi:MAG: D-2-hydroxyacid dehydrogenase [Desulfovibrionaceae bacterium]|nr:D-2-hydroxyacid dehydrogenase [Desulfovibrionaceae bacterium]
MKIVILDGYTENPGDLSWEGLERLGDLTVYDRTPKEQIVSRIGHAKIVITNKTPITREHLEACPDIRLIAMLATGYDVVDIAEAKKRGIPVVNVPSYGTEAVAQYAIALLLELTSRVGLHDAAVKAGKWSQSLDWCFWESPLMELAGKVLGIIGFGRIGQTTGRIAKAMGMHVLAYDIHQSESGKAIAEYVSLDTLLKKSDVICLHCNLTSETKNIINSGAIAKMKDKALIINNSRGPLICEQDLADALNRGKLGGAAVDVVTSEPIAQDNPLLTAKNCIITPHLSWAPKECRQRIMDITVENVKAFLQGTPIHVVNP